MKKILIISGVIVVLIIGWFVFQKTANKEIAPSETTTGIDVAPLTEKNVITYGSSGFSSNPIKIKVGDTIVFINETDRPLWVASAPHPTHTDYPEFDARRGYNKGENYSFTFLKPGTWRYHNHLKPEDFGSIIVE